MRFSPFKNLFLTKGRSVHSETTPLNVRRNAYLVSYIKYRYANKPGAKKSVFEEIVRYWQGLLDDKVR